jgi:ATP synthase protein I
MLRRVILYDGIIMLLSFVISMIFFREFTVIIIIGVAIALLNFFLNSAITEYAMKASKGMLWILVGAVARIAIAGAFVLILYNDDMRNVIAYIVGYSLHYASMAMGAASRKNKT